MAPFGIYVHWPFCLSKCPYCDFNSHVRDRVDQDRWRRAMLCEIDHTANDWDGGQVTSIFFGGGTPSLMPPETVAAIIEQIDRCWGLAEDVEITAEATPTSVESARFSALQEAGVNRCPWVFKLLTTRSPFGPGSQRKNTMRLRSQPRIRPI